MHSSISDGTLSPSEVVSRAAEAGLDLIALTDHDTTGGVREARDKALDVGLRFIVGTEISASVRGHEVHLLAYGFDLEDEGIDSFLGVQRSRRDERAMEFVHRLKSIGALPAAAAPPQCEPGRSIARPHIARMLLDAGTVSDFNDAFRFYLTKGCKTFVPKPLPEGSQVMRVVHEAGGKVVLAHPGHNIAHQTVLDLLRGGLDGLEVIHPSHDDMLRDYYRSLARKNNLMVTGGSDYHAHETHGGPVLGEFWFEPSDAVLNLIRTQ